MRALGCLGVLLVLSWLFVEAWVYIITARLLNASFGESIGSGGWWLPAVWIIVMAVVGVKVVKHHVAQVVPGLLTGKAGRHVVGALGGVLLLIPGLVSDVVGLVLLIPPVQILLGKLGNAVVASIIKRTMGNMFGGGKANPLGGFPMGGPFPGMSPRADDRAAFKIPKTYDTTVERDR